MIISKSMKGRRVLAISACILALVMCIGIFAGAKVSASSAEVAKIGSTGYASLSAAIKAAKEGDTITLVADSTEALLPVVSKSITIDLNGKTFTDSGLSKAYSLAVTTNATLTITDGVGSGKFVADSGAGIYASAGNIVVAAGTIVNSSGCTVSVNDGSITINGGNINCTKEDGYAVYAYNGHSPLITVNGGTISSNGYGVAFGDCSATFTMTAGEINGDAFAIATNGSVKNQVTMNISGGYLSSNTIAAYLPSGTMTVSGGTFSGATALYMKSGNLTITGGTFKATGAKVGYSYNGNGADPTGDAIVIDNCGYPLGEPVVNIAGGSFSSANALSVATYSYGGKALIEKFISGGTFADPVIAQNCAVGYRPITNADGTYGVSNLYTVSFDVAGVAAQAVAYGSTATKPADPAMEGYLFVGWFLGDAEYDFSTPVTADIALTAKWEKIPEHTFAEFIERLYNVALNRESEPEGKQFWMNKVLKEGFTGGDCARGFLTSKEFKNRELTDEQFIKILYKTFFDRDPDQAGYIFWLDLLKNGGYTRDQVVDGFIDSIEWCNLCAYYNVKSGAPNAKAENPSSNAIKFATRLYNFCLERDPEEGGLKFWALRLTNLESSGAEAARDFFNSEEYLQKNTTNEQYLTALYRTFMGREPDDSGFQFWMGHLTTDMTRMDVLKGFAQSEEFTNICAEYGIDRGTL